MLPNIVNSQSIFGTGANFYGSLGDGTNISKNSPVQTGTYRNWNNIGIGDHHTIAIKTDGTLWAWGWNFSGQLGDGTTVDKNIPTQIGIATNWNIAIGGGIHTLAIKTDGTLWAWGYNGYGQLGDGTNVNKSVPVQIGAATNWSSIECGENHSAGIKSDGTLWAWGYNSTGQLGDGTIINKNLPNQVGVATNWSKVSCGTYYTMAIKLDGTLWAWGMNGNSQLGDGTVIDQYTPIQIGVATNWSKLSAGAYHTIAIKTDGTLWAWGWNANGQLGDGTLIDKSIPTQIGVSTNWSKVICGQFFTLAIKTDGTIWAWGKNLNGQLGNGTNIDLSVPTQIGISTNIIDISTNNESLFSMYLFKALATLTTTAISSVTTTTASSGGNVTSDGGASVTARGVCWNTSTAPTIANTKTTNLSGLGTFTSSLTGLSLGTTYYVRAYATNSEGTSYGNEVTFTTLNVPTLTTTSATNVLGTTATSGGNVSNDGGASITAEGIVWGTSSGATVLAHSGITNDGTGLGAFISSMTGLNFVTTYYVRAYSTNSIGTAYGNEISFITNASSVVITSDILHLNATKAFVSGRVTSDGGVAVTKSGIVWSTSSNPTVNGSDSVNLGSGVSYFSGTISNLASGTKYYMKAFAINSDGISYSTESILYQPDLDGISDIVELAAPNSGDGNNDGIPDFSQFSVSSFKNINGNYITISSLGGNTLIDTKSNISPDKSSYTYPLGVYEFKINALRDTINLYFHNTSSLSNYVYRKLNAQGKWINYEKATFSSVIIDHQQVAKVTIVLEDGGIGDADGVLNGVIYDPGGPAIIITPANIPGFSEWARYSIFMLLIFGFWWKTRIYIHKL